MKKKILFLTLIYGLMAFTPLKANCFIAMENNKVLQQVGNCTSRHLPCSTFKIAISLMGYNERFLIDETHPNFPFKDGYADDLEIWKQLHNPKTWIKNSCIWYSRLITQNLGMEKFKKYVKEFDYGNQDVSGDTGQNNGLTHAWLSSSLKISPLEQIQFLKKLIDDQLPVSKKSQRMTKNILFTENLDQSWKMYGKTGSGHFLNSEGLHYKEIKMGWFVGWLQKDNRYIIFAHYIEDTGKQNNYLGLEAKAIAKQKLRQLLDPVA